MVVMVVAMVAMVMAVPPRGDDLLVVVVAGVRIVAEAHFVSRFAGPKVASVCFVGR